MSHSERVASIADEVRRRVPDGGPGAAGRAGGQAFASLGKAAVSHMVPNPHDPRHRDRKINIRELNHILSIDPGARTCTAESGVTFSDLVRATLPHGLIPMLVPELKTITVGGAVSGCSVESMSYKYGGFHDSCLSYEVVTGTGQVLRCSRDTDPEIFEMLHGSYGTLGILTELTFRLVPALPFVRMEHKLYRTMAEFHEQMLAHMELPDVDFIDGIVHGREHFVLSVGRFVKDAPRTSSYDGLDIYYRSTLARREDHLTTYDYLFRYDRECHWLSRTIPGMETRLGRLLLGGLLLGSTNLLTWSKRLRPVLKLQRRPPVVVDVFIPNRRLREFYAWYEEAFDYYPLWVVPYRIMRPYPWVDPGHKEHMGEALMIDCAVYGKANDRPGVNYARLLEEKTYELGGVKTLISENHYSEDRFWSIYHREHYQAIKRRMDPHNLFRGLYEKFNFRRD